ncbi:uncharacterized protein LOC144625441 isoform X2 [Crassostrea virginica]
MSRRSKKRVDYSQFGFMDEDDDDFAEFTPPASKKIKTSSSKSDGKVKDQTIKNKTKEGRGERKALNRPKPTDEAFENELQMALALSQSETQDVQVEVPLVEGDKENTLQTGGDNEKSEEEANISSDSINQDNQDTPNLCKPSAVVSKSDDEIEVIATDIKEDGKPKRASTSKKAKKQEESDYEDDLDDFSSNDDDDNDDDDDYDGEDSDFDDGKKKSKSKAKKTVKSPKATKGKTNSTKTTKPAAASSKAASKSVTKSSVKPVGSRTPVVSKSSVSRPSPAARPALSSPSPRWNPPGPAGPKKGDANSIQSPTSGLRLGLSRNMKLKPLHPNLKVQH